MIPLVLLAQGALLTGTGRSAIGRVHNRARAQICMQDSFDFESLNARIAEVARKAEPEVVRILALDSMVPGQRLKLEAPAPFINMFEYWSGEMNQSVVMVGQNNDETAGVFSHGVEVTMLRQESATSNMLRVDGSAEIELVAGRYAEVLSMGADEGSLYLGRAGAVNWIDVSVNSTAPEEKGARARLRLSPQPPTAADTDRPPPLAPSQRPRRSRRAPMLSRPSSLIG